MSERLLARRGHRQVRIRASATSNALSPVAQRRRLQSRRHTARLSQVSCRRGPAPQPLPRCLPAPREPQHQGQQLLAQLQSPSLHLSCCWSRWARTLRDWQMPLAQQHLRQQVAGLRDSRQDLPGFSSIHTHKQVMLFLSGCLAHQQPGSCSHSAQRHCIMCGPAASQCAHA